MEPGMSYEILHGDSIAVLRALPSESIDCCVTLPPYWGLRDYGVDGQIGLEKTPEEFVAKLVEVFREVRRVLKADGTCFVNLGDSYAAAGGSGRQGKNGDRATRTHTQECLLPNSAEASGLKPKDLIGIPWRVAFALQADGWWLRQDIIWHKPNPMPESVRDRCTKAHEYVFLLTKAERYFWDAGAIAEPVVKGYAGSNFNTGKSGVHQLNRSSDKPRVHGNLPGRSDGGAACNKPGQETRNRRSVWTLATQPTPDAHFATYPIELPELCIMAGSREGGLILDPFNGAGTTGMAALKNGRRYIGIELNAEYIDITHRRFQRHMPLLAVSQ